MSGPYDDLPYKDVSTIRETYAENVHTVAVQNGVALIILTVNRPEMPKPNMKKATGSKVTAVRLAMPLSGLLELHQQLE